MINEATLQYVSQHVHDDVRTLALRGCKAPGVDLSVALQQIQGRQTAQHKLPSWAIVDGIIYPPHLNMEQCSSELTARYKRKIVDKIIFQDAGRIVNHKFLDLTGGFGVDFSFMADTFDEAIYVERDPYLCELATCNLALLGKGNVTTVCADASSYLSSIPIVEKQRFTLIFLDPARRDTHGARTYALTDCTPDVTAMMNGLLRRSSYLLLKLSPMLDWRKAVADLMPHRVAEVHIVAVDNECKELLLLLVSQNVSQQPTAPRLVCTDIHSRDGSRILYSPSSLSSCPVNSDIHRDSPYLYEPNAAVMKAGCFRELAADFGISQLAPNSHLFTSENHVKDFPGRSFRITAVTTMNKRDLRATLGSLQRANIAVRNFPLTAEELRRRLKLADGGTDYIFATTLSNGSHVIVLCTKIEQENAT